MKNYNFFNRLYNKFIKYTPLPKTNFYLTTENYKQIDKTPINPSKNLEPKNISSKLTENLDYIKTKYNYLINSDVIIRDFTLISNNQEYNASLIFIDGLVDTQIVNSSVLKPLMLRNRSNIFTKKNNFDCNLYEKQKKKEKVQGQKQWHKKEKNSKYNNNTPEFDLKDYIYKQLITQNSVKKVESFNDIFTSINMGNSVLFVDTLNVAFNIDAKGFKQRSINSPQNEIVVRGSQEAFVENIRTNTSIIRRLINTENLVIENTSIGKINQTPVGICYLKDFFELHFLWF